MIDDRSDYDVAIVGASIAGSAAAGLLARQGARVALIERRSDPDAFKRVCGHFIQPSAVPELERLGVLGELERLGAYRGRPRVWTRYGWLEPTLATAASENGHDEARRSLSIRREVLDPLLRRTAAETPGVDLMLGATLEELVRGDGRVRGVVASRRGGDRTRITARVVVGADGRRSRTAQLAGLRTRTSRNLRFGYWGYFDGPRPASRASVELWMLEPDVAIATPTDSGLTLYVAFPHRSRAGEFKRDPEAALRAFVQALPDAPPIADARRVGPMVGKLDLTNEWRRASGAGIALIGDAAIAADPVGAIGCGWALQSARWLAESLAPAIAEQRSVKVSLREYRRRHRRELLGHSLLAADGARADRLSPIQRLMFSAAVRDPRLALHVEAFAGREIRPHRFLAPAALAHAARVNLRPPESAAYRARTAPS